MKYSYNWLKKLSGTRLSAEKLAEMISLKAFEVEGVQTLGAQLEGVVAGEILEIEKHPNADKLQLALVEIGGKKLKVVCGAPNIKVGQKVPVATMGTTLPGGFEIKAAEIRGVESQGMLCAEDELGLGSDHSGIMILPPKTKPGTALAKVLGLDDTVLEIDILANRAHDALSHVGMAREVAVITGGKFDYAYDELKLPVKKSTKLAVKIQNKQIAKRYLAAEINEIAIGPSPLWLQSALKALGLKSINNVVDVTNYVMLELGQPLHAFDADKLEAVSGKIKLEVRLASGGEQIELLDGSKKTLQPADIVIADSVKAVALAGIMGAGNSEVDEKTKNIVLEAANFDASTIRQTRMRLGLATDAAMRFEKKIDPNLAEKALVRAIELIEKLAAGKFAGAVDEYPQPVKPWQIDLAVDETTELLGEKIPVVALKKILGDLGMKIRGAGKKLHVTVPTFRLDLQTQEDLIEEIGRVWGYEKIASVAPQVALGSSLPNLRRRFERKTKDMLAGLGFSEIYNYAFYGDKEMTACHLGGVQHLELDHPLTPEHKYLRISLLPALLKNVHENLKYFNELAIFEAGKVYWDTHGELPQEKNMLALALCGTVKNSKHGDKRAQELFFQAKQVADALLARLGFADWYYDTFDSSPLETPRDVWHQTRSAEIKLTGKDKPVGFIGEISPQVLSAFDVPQRVAVVEFDLDLLEKEYEEEFEYAPIGKYPEVMRDLSLLAEGPVLVDQMLQVIQKNGGELLRDADLFDIFDFSDGKTSYAFHLKFTSHERTLKSEEIDALVEKITATLEHELPVKVRK